MDPTSRPRIKVCCITSHEEARVAVRAGASALGLVSQMPSGPGVISESLIADIAAGVPPGIASFLLTCRSDADGIVTQQHRTGVNTIQICDEVERGTHAELRERLPGVKIVQVVHVRGEASVDEAAAAALHVDALLLDSGNQSLAVKELGGTGRRHDWRLSARIREMVEVPVWLAGGLDPSNAREAIEQVGPFGLDVCSGLRTRGELDPAKVEAFFAAAWGAGAEVA
jgi:phosphoribosylanthranilate isomerase